MSKRFSDLMLGATIALSGCSSPERAAIDVAPGPPVVSESAASIFVRGEPLQPLPDAKPVDPRRAALGGKLFSNPSLSSDGTVSCITCHPLDRGGADGLSHSRGAGGKETALNTPTIYNATYNFRYNWNGAYATLEDEFDAPVTKTLGTSWEGIYQVVHRDSSIRTAFEAAYPDGVTIGNIKDALARFVDTLVTPNARFDRYLRGDTEALSNDERRGYDMFKELGCASCHQGANIGGNLFQRFGVMQDYFRERTERGGPPPAAAELGRFNVTKSAADRHVFRVPSLRNVALTPPYFHNGSAATLEVAVSAMGRLQLGRTLSSDQVAAIVAFLRTLTGEMRRGTP